MRVAQSTQSDAATVRKISSPAQTQDFIKGRLPIQIQKDTYVAAVMGLINAGDVHGARFYAEELGLSSDDLRHALREKIMSDAKNGGAPEASYIMDIFGIEKAELMEGFTAIVADMTEKCEFSAISKLCKDLGIPFSMSRETALASIEKMLEKGNINEIVDAAAFLRLSKEDIRTLDHGKVLSLVKERMKKPYPVKLEVKTLDILGIEVSEIAPELERSVVAFLEKEDVKVAKILIVSFGLPISSFERFKPVFVKHLIEHIKSNNNAESATRLAKALGLTNAELKESIVAVVNEFLEAGQMEKALNMMKTFDLSAEDVMPMRTAQIMRIGRLIENAVESSPSTEGGNNLNKALLLMQELGLTLDDVRTRAIDAVGRLIEKGYADYAAFTMNEIGLTMQEIKPRAIKSLGALLLVGTRRGNSNELAPDIYSVSVTMESFGLTKEEVKEEVADAIAKLIAAGNVQIAARAAKSLGIKPDDVEQLKPKLISGVSDLVTNGDVDDGMLVMQVFGLTTENMHAELVAAIKHLISKGDIEDATLAIAGFGLEEDTETFKHTATDAIAKLVEQARIHNAMLTFHSFDLSLDDVRQQVVEAVEKLLKKGDVEAAAYAIDQFGITRQKTTAILKKIDLEFSMRNAAA